MDEIMDEIMDENMNYCAICHDEENTCEFVRKWKCNHTFHSTCIENWDHSCPYCRCEELDEDLIEPVSWQISRNPTNVLNIDNIRNINPITETSIKQIYLNKWKDRDCIRNGHTMFCCQPYGVLLICEDCNTIQTFNCMH